MWRIFADIESTKVSLLWVIALSLVLLNVQFFSTFRLNRTVQTSGYAQVSGTVEVTSPSTGDPSQEQGESASSAAVKMWGAELRSVLNDCSISPSFSGATVSESIALDVNCYEPRLPGQ